MLKPSMAFEPPNPNPFSSNMPPDSPGETFVMSATTSSLVAPLGKTTLFALVDVCGASVPRTSKPSMVVISLKVSIMSSGAGRLVTSSKLAVPAFSSISHLGRDGFAGSAASAGLNSKRISRRSRRRTAISRSRSLQLVGRGWLGSSFKRMRMVSSISSSASALALNCMPTFPLKNPESGAVIGNASSESKCSSSPEASVPSAYKYSSENRVMLGGKPFDP